MPGVKEALAVIAMLGLPHGISIYTLWRARKDVGKAFQSLGGKSSGREIPDAELRAGLNLVMAGGASERCSASEECGEGGGVGEGLRMAA